MILISNGYERWTNPRPPLDAALLLFCVVIVVAVSVIILFTLSAPGLAPVQPHIVLIIAGIEHEDDKTMGLPVNDDNI